MLTGTTGDIAVSLFRIEIEPLTPRASREQKLQASRSFCFCFFFLYRFEIRCHEQISRGDCARDNTRDLFFPPAYLPAALDSRGDHLRLQFCLARMRPAHRVEQRVVISSALTAVELHDHPLGEVYRHPADRHQQQQ